jgi:hypothetical protein
MTIRYRPRSRSLWRVSTLQRRTSCIQAQPTHSVIFNRNLLVDTDARNLLLKSGIFRVPKTGLYWFHLETHTDKDGRANYNLIGGSSDVERRLITELRSNCPNMNTPTLSQDSLRSLKETNQLYTTSAYAAYAFTNDTYATAWSGFELTELLGDRPVAFSVVNSAIFYLEPVVRFSTVQMDTDNSWDKVNSAFVAPVDGVYVLSISTTVSIPNHRVDIVKLMRGTRPLFPAGNQLKLISCNTLDPNQCITTFSLTMVTMIGAEPICADPLRTVKAQRAY